MNEFINLKQDEMQDINGGGLVSMVAGGLAGAIIGVYVTLPVALIKNDASIVAKGAILGGSVGAYVGAGCPLP